MMFMMPMPPTTSEIGGGGASSTLKMLCVSLRVRINSAMLRTWKSSKPALTSVFAQQTFDFLLRVAHPFGGGDLDHDRRRLFGDGTLGAEQPAPRGRQRHERGIVLIGAPARLAFDRQHADHGEGHVLMRDFLAYGQIGAEQISRAVVARKPPPWRRREARPRSLRPSATGQSRTSRKYTLTPLTDVVQLALPTTTGAEPCTMPAAAVTPGTLAR